MNTKRKRAAAPGQSGDGPIHAGPETGPQTGPDLGTGTVVAKGPSGPDVADGPHVTEHSLSWFSADEPEQPGWPLHGGRLASVLESLLFASDKPLSLEKIHELLEQTAAGPNPPDGPGLYKRQDLERALADLSEQLDRTGRGVGLLEVAGGFQLRTAPKNAPWVARLLQQKPVRLSRAQLETLAIVAYRQPITRPEVDDIRGVDSGAALRTLLDRNLIRVLGKKEEPGRPLLWGTTREFLEFFNLKELKDLPTLREYHDLTDESRETVRAAGFSPPSLPLHDDSPGLSSPLSPAQDAAPGGEAVPNGDSDRVPAAAALERQLADDTEHLARIDEMIRAVSTQFPLMDPTAADASRDVGNRTENRAESETE